MPEDEIVAPEEVEVADAAPEETQEPDAEQPDPDAGYQGKLNATNRFLKKEGYTFNNETKQWHKPAASTLAQPAPAKEQKPTSLTRDEAIVIAKGFSVEELEHANKVASIEGCSVLEALDNPLFKGWKSQREADAKQQAAQLGVGRGSRASSAKKTFGTKGLSEEDHKALFNEKVGG